MSGSTCQRVIPYHTATSSVSIIETLYERTVKASLIRHIVDQQNSHGTSVVCGGDGPEPFLSCGVPYLQLYPLAVQLNRPNLEVDADGGDEGRCEGVFAEAQQAAGLAYA